MWMLYTLIAMLVVSLLVLIIWCACAINADEDD